MKKRLNWLDKYLLSVWAGFLLFFIPWYPKLPIADVLPGYIVRIRLEDFFILIGIIILLVYLIRRRPKLKQTPLFWPIIIYLIIGFLSSISALFISRTVPLETIHVAKVFLHWARRVEYFSLFFIFYFGVKAVPKKWQQWLFWPLLVVLLGVVIYGFGQKYLYWPVFSTMNREFSKGMKLYLTEHARVPSTFGGHYDLAIFLVILLPVILSLIYSAKKWLKLIPLAVFSLGFWLLVLTASRTSFIAYLLAIAVLYLVLAFKKGWWWGLWRGSLVLGLSLLVMIFFGDLSSRYAHLVNNLKQYPQVCLDEELSQQPFVLAEETALPGRKSSWEKPQIPAAETSFCQTVVKLDSWLDFSNLAQKWNDSRFMAWYTDFKEKQKSRSRPAPTISDSVLTQTDVLPEPTKTLPPDVYVDVPEPQIVVEPATPGEPLPTPKVVYVPRTYSENAYKYGLSLAIRLDALWPRAWERFKLNPLLGSGYSTLTKEKLTDFTEAESTDNDYLRMLGETGLLGFISFMTILGLVVYQAIRGVFKQPDNYIQLVSASFLAVIVGLLLNAMYIDVFEASKVAYTLWAVVGIYFASAPAVASRKKKK